MRPGVSALVALSIAVVAPRAEAGRGANLVKYLPADADFVVVADFAKTRR
jgi:hypothetical protein